MKQSLSAVYSDMPTLIGTQPQRSLFLQQDKCRTGNCHHNNRIPIRVSIVGMAGMQKIIYRDTITIQLKVPS